VRSQDKQIERAVGEANLYEQGFTLLAPRPSPRPPSMSFQAIKTAVPGILIRAAESQT